MDQRAEAVGDRIADNAVDARVRVEALVAIDVVQVVPRRHARGDAALLVEGAVGERRAEARAEDAAGQTQLAHAERDGWPGRLAEQIEHAEVVALLVGGDGDLDHVGVLGAHARVDLLQVGRHLAEVVVTNDALDVLEAANLVDDVGFQVHPVETRDDGLAQQGLPFLLGTGKAAAVHGPANGGDHGAGLVGQQPLEIGGLGEEIQPQLHEAGAALARLLDFDLHHLVAGAADDDADLGGNGRGSGGFSHGVDSSTRGGRGATVPDAHGRCRGLCGYFNRAGGGGQGKRRGSHSWWIGAGRRRRA